MYIIRTLECADCGYIWDVPFGIPMLHVCPKCGSKTVFVPAYEESADHDTLDPRLFS